MNLKSQSLFENTKIIKQKLIIYKQINIKDNNHLKAFLLKETYHDLKETYHEKLLLTDKDQKNQMKRIMKILSKV